MMKRRNFLAAALGAGALAASAGAEPGTQSELTAIAGQGAGLVEVAPTAHDVAGPGTFDVQGTVNVHDAVPNATFTVLRRVDLNPDGVCTGATWLNLPGTPTSVLTTSNGGAGALHFEIARGAPFLDDASSTCSGVSRGATAPSSGATASPSR
jgi:hypothetical protein